MIINIIVYAENPLFVVDDLIKAVYFEVIETAEFQIVCTIYEPFCYVEERLLATGLVKYIEI